MLNGPPIRTRMRSYRPRLLLSLIWLATLAAPGFGEDATTTRLRHAGQSLSAGHLDRAEDELQSVLRTAPEEDRALDLLGVARILQHREADAEILFQRSIQNKPDFASAHAHLGLLYLQTGRENDGVPELQEAVRLDPARTDASDALVHLFRKHARAAASSGSWKQALGLLIQARKLAPKNPDVQFEFGTAAFQMSLMQDAVNGFKETLSLRKDDPSALYGLGRAYGNLGRLDDARQQFVLYIALHPDDPSGYCSLGITLAALERSDEARAQFERSIAIAPEQAEAYFRLGTLDLRNGKWESAKANLRHVLDRNPEHVGALSALGRVEFEQQHYAEAAALLRRATDIDDSLLEAHYYLGLAYGRVGQRVESEQQFQRSTELQHEDLQKRRALWNRLDLPPATPQPQRP